MELRFLEGNWEHGRFKLQMKSDGFFGNHEGKPIEGWVDVPCVKEEKKKEWCEHKDEGLLKFCPICGVERP